MTARRPAFRVRFGTALAAGAPGVAALVAYVFLTTPDAAVPGGLSRPAFAVLSAVTPLLLLVGACLVGAYAAPRARLRSHLLDRAGGEAGALARLRPELGVAVAVGVAGSLAVIALDVALAPFVARDLPGSAVGAARPTAFDVLAFAPVRFLYGGVTEELLLRFGLMSVLALGGWRLAGRGGDAPGPGVMWAAIALSALLFGAGHLPALAAAVGLTPALVARTVLLNAVAGVAFGWLYWRRSLEAAMVAHAAFHVPLVALSLVQVL
jgi:membrane protease YdiL (CAAX protease family)